MMVMRGMLYEHWLALTPDEQWQSFCELEAELHRLQDERAKEIRVTLTISEDQREALRWLAHVRGGGG